MYIIVLGTDKQVGKFLCKKKGKDKNIRWLIGSLFNVKSCIYIYIYIYMCVCVCVWLVGWAKVILLSMFD